MVMRAMPIPITSLAHSATTGQTVNDHHDEAHVPESHTGQGATAAELETLTDLSNADLLHLHDSALKAVIVEGSRTAAAGAGAQSFTGAGFVPTAIEILAADDGSDEASWGVGDDVLFEFHIRSVNGNFSRGGGTLVNINDGTNIMSAVLTSLDADGCTITWSKTAAGIDSQFGIRFLR